MQPPSGTGTDRDTVLSGLMDAGLSEYQAEAYLTLLEQGTTKAVDVAHRSSIPVPRIYDVVNELEQKGYVETLDRETLHVRAHEPVDVIQDLHDRSQRISTVADSIEELWEETPVAEHDVTVTKRAATVVDKARDLIREADTTVELAATAEEFRTFEEALASLAGSDVVVRVSLDSTDDVGDLLDDALLDAITEVRVREFSAPLVVAVDGETTYFAPTGTVPDPFGVTVKGDHLTLVFRWFFQTCLWSVWEPYSAYDGERTAFASLREFVCEVYEAWDDGAEILLQIDGVDTTTGERTSLTGTLAEVRYTGSEDADDPPSLTELSGEMAIVVADGDRRHTVGGWGATREDVEARRIQLLAHDD